MIVQFLQFLEGSTMILFAFSTRITMIIIVSSHPSIFRFSCEIFGRVSVFLTNVAHIVQYNTKRVGKSPVVELVVGLVDISPRTKIKQELGNIDQLGPGKSTFH